MSELCKECSHGWERHGENGCSARPLSHGGGYECWCSLTGECAFCRIAARVAPAEVVASDINCLVIVPLKPVTPGHVLVIPRVHVEDFTTAPLAAARVMSSAARYAKDIGPCNVITSKGREATQSVFHLHLHVVPRAENDGLALPWYSGKRRKKMADDAE